MKYVKRQLELIKELCDEMLENLDSKSAWKDKYLHRRIDEAKAIASAADTLIMLVKRRRMR